MRCQSSGHAAVITLLFLCNFLYLVYTCVCCVTFFYHILGEWRLLITQNEVKCIDDWHLCLSGLGRAWLCCSGEILSVSDCPTMGLARLTSLSHSFIVGIAGVLVCPAVAGRLASWEVVTWLDLTATARWSRGQLCRRVMAWGLMVWVGRLALRRLQITNSLNVTALLAVTASAARCVHSNINRHIIAVTSVRLVQL